MGLLSRHLLIHCALGVVAAAMTLGGERHRRGSRDGSFGLRTRVSERNRAGRKARTFDRGPPKL